MVEEIISSIIEAENKAEEIKKHALTEARELVAEEEVKNENERRLAETDCKKKYKENILKFQENAEQEALLIIEDGKEKAGIIEKEAEKNIDKAVTKIIEELFN